MQILLNAVPAILSGPMDLYLKYSENLMATFTCTAFGGSGIEIEFSWSATKSSIGFSSLVETLNDDDSITSTVTTNVFSPEDSGGEYRCAVNFNGSNTYESSETATLGIGKRCTYKTIYFLITHALVG